MLTFLGSVHPFHDSLLQPCPGHKRKNGFIPKFDPRASRVRPVPVVIGRFCGAETFAPSVSTPKALVIFSPFCSREFWTAHPRDRIFGSRIDAFSTQFIGFSICHPMYDDKRMLKIVQRANASALNNDQEATATLLPNAFHKTTWGMHT